MTTPLRIVLDVRATTAHFPGVARATLGLLQGLCSVAHPHEIIALTEAGVAPTRDADYSQVAYVATQAGPLSAQQQWALPLLARRLRPDVWHAPYYIRPFIGVPRPIVTVFDLIGHIVPDALPSLRARLLFELTLRLSVRRAVHIITSSQATRRDLIDVLRLDPSTITVVPLAADDRFAPQSTTQEATVRERYGLNKRYLLYLGSNKPHKNIALLVRAFARLDTDVSLVIAGRWDERYNEPKQLVHTLDLNQRVRFIHDIADADVPALLSGALAFVFPSRYEGFGLPPLEAMACGTPVIATATSSLPEVVGDAGVLVKPEAVALRNAMQMVLGDAALRQQLRQKGLTRAAQFSWRSTAEQTLVVYERVART